MQHYPLTLMPVVARFFIISLVLCSSLVFAKSPGLTSVFVTRVQLSAIEDRIEAIGTLRANESVNLTTSVTETVTALHFDDGDQVEAGQVLVEMTSNEERAQIEEARATMAEALAQYERIKSLQSTQTAAKSLLDQRLREWETGRARLAAIESHLADRQIRAPFSGVVGLRYVSVGALLEPGDLITTLDDNKIMKLDFPIPAIYFASLTPGLPVIATTRAWSGLRFEGQVKSIDSRIDPVTRTVVLRALLSNPEQQLRPGMLMQVELLKHQREAIVIPEECLVPQGHQQFVFVVDPDNDNTVEHREISIGKRRAGEVEVTDGLTAGELVITDGTLKVRAGSKVKISAMDDGTTPISELLKAGPTK